MSIGSIFRKVANPLGAGCLITAAVLLLTSPFNSKSDPRKAASYDNACLTGAIGGILLLGAAEASRRFSRRRLG